MSQKLIVRRFAPAYFVAAYFLKLGFLDGRAGLSLWLHKAAYFRQVRSKIRNLERSQPSTAPSAASNG